MRDFKERGGYGVKAVQKFLMNIAAEANRQNPPADVWDVLDRAGQFMKYYRRPLHLAPLAETCNVASSDIFRAVVHVASQNGKTTFFKAELSFLVQTQRAKRHVYLTYNMTRALVVMAEFENTFCINLGVPYTKRGNELKFDGGVEAGGSTIVFASVGSFGAGTNINGLCIIDDPFAGSADAGSVTEQERVWRWFLDVLLQRQGPYESFSIVSCATRWCENDLSGRILAHLQKERVSQDGAKRTEWPYICLSALCMDPINDPLGRQLDEPLMPDSLFTFEYLDEKRQSEPVSFSASYQGHPEPMGGRFFKDFKQYNATFDGGRLLYTMGFDGAGTDKSTSDWSVLYVLCTNLDSGVTHVVEVVRRQMRYTDFLPLLLEVWERYRVPVRWWVGGQEASVAELASELMEYKHGVKDFPWKVENGAKIGGKATRAGKVRVAWNDGKVLYPSKDEFSREMKESVRIIQNFKDDPRFKGHEDDMDALAAAYQDAYDAMHHVVLPLTPMYDDDDPEDLFNAGRRRRSVS